MMARGRRAVLVLLITAVCISTCGSESPLLRPAAGGPTDITRLRRHAVARRPTLHARAQPAPARQSSIAAVCKAVLPIAALAGVNAASSAVLSSIGLTFSPSLLSMMAIAASMCMLAAVRLDLAERVHAFFAPGCSFLTRWLPAFYVPGIVPLPWTLPALPPASFLALILFCHASLALHAALVIALVCLARGSATPDVPPPAPLSTPAPAIGTRTNASPSPRIGGSLARRLLLVSTAILGGAALALRGTSAGNQALHGYYMALAPLGLTVGELLPARVRTWVHPIVLAVIFNGAALSAMATALGRPLQSAVSEFIAGGGGALGAMLGPAVASFAFALYTHRRDIASRGVQVLGVIGTSACLGLAISAASVRALGIAPGLRSALLPRSITMPLALEATACLRAERGIAILAVVITGLTTIPLGKPLLDHFGVRDPVARGLSLSCAGNAGSTLALADDADSFPFAVGGMVLNGALVVTLLSMPWVRKLLALLTISTGQAL